MKTLNIPKETQEALLNGASAFIVPSYKIREDFLEEAFTFNKVYTNLYIKQESPYQIGDEVYIAEDGILLMSNPPQPKIIYKATIKDVKVVRVQDIDYTDKLGFTELDVTRFGYVGNWYSKQYKNYEDNPYVFLYEVERIKND